jgi:hypothetical protein
MIKKIIYNKICNKYKNKKITLNNYKLKISIDKAD